MRRAILMIALLGLSVPLFADDAPRPDYSRETLFRFSHDFIEHHDSTLLNWDLGNLGAINIYHFGLHGIFNYLPFLAPLPGSRLKDTATVPNAFELTHTAIARSMPYMSDDRSAAVKREINRVLKMEKQAKIKVDTE